MMFFVFTLGLAVGSFLNLLIDRMPKGEDIIWKPSHCDYCRKRLRWHDLIPLLSYALLGGRCRNCKRMLSPAYPLVELVTAISLVSLYSLSLPLGIMIPVGILIASGIVMVGIDLRHQILPDSMLVCWGIAIAMLAVQASSDIRWMHATTAAATGLFFLVLWFVTRGRGIGFGDVKLAALIGALIGFPFVIVALYVAFLTGAAVGVILIITHRAGMKSRIAFGPFLIAGTLIAGVWGNHIIALWMRLL